MKKIPRFKLKIQEQRLHEYAETRYIFSAEGPSKKQFQSVFTISDRILAECKDPNNFIKIATHKNRTEMKLLRKAMNAGFIAGLRYGKAVYKTVDEKDLE